MSARLRARLALLVITATALTAAAAEAPFPPVVAGHPLSFPADFGSHPEFRTEWWYVTGWLHTKSGAPLGFQVTFFRIRPGVAEDNPSALAARQLLIAHAAVSDPALGHLWQEQKMARAGLELAEARTGDTGVWIDRWRLTRRADDYEAEVTAEDFALALTLRATQAPLLEGEAGFSRKGPNPAAASYYYSVPHLAVSGVVTRRGRREEVTGEAWLDHEWSSEYLDAAAVGWDWTGVNLDDGGALMAFRIRGKDGRTYWAAATWRGADGSVRRYGPDAVSFEPERLWRSRRTGVRYPVAMRLRVGTLDLELEPLLDDQENDTRLSTGTIYWEGAVRAGARGQRLGQGYLELTGYGERVRLR